MKQEGDEWHSFRRKGIGSSDAPVIMSVSPYSTPYQLYCEKLGLPSNREVNEWITRKGHRMEPIARAHYELMTGRDMPAAVMTAKDAPWLRASLDGFNGERILEIKCPGRADHFTALEGLVPEKYYPQVQHQMIVAGVDVCDYFSFDGTEGVIVTVPFDEDFAERYLKRALEFWLRVVEKNPPAYQNKDYTLVKDPELLIKIKLWRMTGNDIFEDYIREKYAGMRIRHGIYFVDENGIHVDRGDGQLRKLSGQPSL